MKLNLMTGFKKWVKMTVAFLREILIMDKVINVVPNADIFRYSQFSTEYGRMFT